YASTSFSIKAHPVSFIRQELDSLRVMSSAALNAASNGTAVKAGGLILVRQRPGTASGICFMTLEDETGTSNLVVYPALFDKYRKEILQSKLLMVEGKLQREGEVVHVIVKRCFNLNRLLGKLTQETLEVKLSRSDEKTAPILTKKEQEMIQVKIF